MCVCVSICFFHVCMPLPIRKCHPWLCVTVPILFPMWASIKHHMFLGVTRHSNSMPKEGADHSNIIILRFRSVHDNFQDKEAIFRPAVNIFLIPYWQYTHVLMLGLWSGNNSILMFSQHCSWVGGLEVNLASNHEVWSRHLPLVTLFSSLNKS